MEGERGYKRQRLRREDQGRNRQDEAAFDVGAGWHNFVLRLGEQCMEYGDCIEPRDQIELCATVLKRNLEALKPDLLPLVMQCAEEIPHKAPLYATLIAILNTEDEDIGASIVDRTYTGIQAAVETEECNKMRILLRFLSLLMVNFVVPPSSVVETSEILLAASAACIVESAPWLQPRADFFVFCVLAALPFGALFLLNKAEEDLERILAAVEAYMTLRTRILLPERRVLLLQAPSSAMESGGASTDNEKDYVEDLWERIQALKEASWKTESVPQPHEGMEEALAGGKAHVMPQITCPPPPSTPPLDASASSSSSVSLSSSRLLFHALEKFPPRLHRLQIFPTSKTDATMAPIDRFLVEEYLLDVMLYLNGCRKECAAYLVGLPVPFRYEFVMAETIFSQLFLLPKPPFRQIYYTVILVDLCKALPGAFPAVLANAVRSLFAKLASMDTECRVRFIQWFSHHLSNFSFIWPWEAWGAVVGYQPWHPQRVFVSQVLEIEVRLSYRDKVRESLGGQRMLPLLPPKPEPTFRYVRSPPLPAPEPQAPATEPPGMEPEGNEPKLAENPASAAALGAEKESVGEESEPDTASDAEVALSKALIGLVKAKKSSKEVEAWVEGQVVPLVGREKECLSLIMQTLLFVGAKSFTHTLTVLERYHQLLHKLASSRPLQVMLVACAVELWKKSPQMGAIVVDKCMGLRIISNLAIVDWVFSPANRSLLHSSLHAWEILQNAINKTVNRTVDLRREVAASKRAAVIAAAAAERAEEERELAEKEAESGEMEEGAKQKTLLELEKAKVRAKSTAEDALSTAETVEAKEALLFRANSEQKALFIAVLSKFSEVLSSQKLGRNEANADMEVVNNGNASLGKKIGGAGGVGERVDDDEEMADKEAVGDGDKRGRVEKKEMVDTAQNVAKGEAEVWMQCCLGTLQAVVRFYASEIWPIMEKVQEEVLNKQVDEDVRQAIFTGLHILA